VTFSTVSAAILAGGRARRFGGRDKSRLVVAGHSIIVRQLDVLQRVAGEIFIVANDASRFADLGVAVHADHVPGVGPMAGLCTALLSASGDPVIVVACDQPFLNAALLRELCTRARGQDGAWVRSDRGVEPLMAAYHRTAAPAIRSAMEAGTRRMQDLGSVLQMAEIGGADLARFGRIDDLVANVNTPGDYARVQYPR
jgi:molybdopterin-guanine dinucleotide biosynthesis protein A